MKANKYSSRGSSPRVQGTQAIDEEEARERRFIPACAWNTPELKQTNTLAAVHPRVCREHGCQGVKVAWVYGSSPRVQGTRVSRCQGRLGLRFIPACAGEHDFQRRRHRSPLWVAVHPRVCREHFESCRQSGRKYGSSPRLQGTRLPYLIETRYGPVHPRVCREHLR